MEHEILDLIDRYWKFDDDQTPVSNWSDKQDLLEAVRKALRKTRVMPSAFLSNNFKTEICQNNHSRTITCRLKKKGNNPK